MKSHTVSTAVTCDLSQGNDLKIIFLKRDITSISDPLNESCLTALISTIAGPSGDLSRLINDLILQGGNDGLPSLL